MTALLEFLELIGPSNRMQRKEINFKITGIAIATYIIHSNFRSFVLSPKPGQRKAEQAMYVAIMHLGLPNAQNSATVHTSAINGFRKYYLDRTYVNVCPSTHIF